MELAKALTVVIDAHDAVEAEAVFDKVLQQVGAPVDERFPAETYPKFPAAWRITANFAASSDETPRSAVATLLIPIQPAAWEQSGLPEQDWSATWARPVDADIWTDPRVRWAHMTAWLYDPDAEPYEFEELEPDPPADEEEAQARLEVARRLAEYAETQERAESGGLPGT